jgi:hypothetical protein
MSRNAFVQANDRPEPGYGSDARPPPQARWDILGMGPRYHEEFAPPHADRPSDTAQKK